jgi:replicative DNA helicase
MKQKVVQTPPTSIDLEMEVLGGIMFYPDALNRVVDTLEVEAFSIESHKVIYKCCLALTSDGKPTDVISVINWLCDHKQIEKAGGKAALVELANYGRLALNIDSYVQELMNKYLSRQLISAGNKIAQMGYDMTQDVEIRLDTAEQEIFGIRNKSSATKKDTIQSAADVCTEIFQEVEQLSVTGKFPSIGTGFHHLDNLLGGGLYPGDLIIVAGRPSMGKTIMGTCLAYNISSTQQMPTLIFSLEMSAKQLNLRYLSGLSSIPLNRLRAGKIESREWSRFSEALGILSALPISVDDSAEPTALQIRSKVRQAIKKHGKLGLVVVDYLQLMVNGADSNVTLKLGEITRQMKLLARECDVPIVCLSQLSRGIEERTNKRPVLSDLRQSGQIEENADVVLMVYRDEYYNANTFNRGIAEIICAKNRNGSTGMIKLLADLPGSRFKNLIF